MTLHELDEYRLIDDVVFVEFDRNPNFILDYILCDVVARLRNQENCLMYFRCDRIVDSLME